MDQRADYVYSHAGARLLRAGEHDLHVKIEKM